MIQASIREASLHRVSVASSIDDDLPPGRSGAPSRVPRPGDILCSIATQSSPCTIRSPGKTRVKRLRWWVRIPAVGRTAKTDRCPATAVLRPVSEADRPLQRSDSCDLLLSPQAAADFSLRIELPPHRAASTIRFQDASEGPCWLIE